MKLEFNESFIDLMREDKKENIEECIIFFKLKNSTLVNVIQIGNVLTFLEMFELIKFNDLSKKIVELMEKNMPRF